VSGSAYGLSHDLNAAADLRDTSLVFVDQRISATQQRIGELEYDCQD
jgi:hypothetical protein